MWNAKPSGAYSLQSAAGKENVLEMSKVFAERGYTDEAKAGVTGNVMAESGLNPWRWQSDTVNTSAGYGLFQFTPATSYLNKAKSLQFYAPNMSTSEVTEGAQPTDGIAQLVSFDTDLLGKWNIYLWRPYWDKTEYADLYQKALNVLDTYGTNRTLSIAQFRQINDIYDATLAFLGCYEGPAVPNMDARFGYAEAAYEIIHGSPFPTGRKGMPVWMMCRRLF